MDIQSIAESLDTLPQLKVPARRTCDKKWVLRNPFTVNCGILWSFGVHCMRSRECGMYEDSDLLLGDSRNGKSDTVQWVLADLPENRKKRVKKHSELVEIHKKPQQFKHF